MASASALLAYGGKRSASAAKTAKQKKTKKKYEVESSATHSTSPVSTSCNANSSVATTATKPQHKVLLAYEDAMRRRDLERVLWMIASGDVDAAYETKSGESAILAAVAAKSVDALRLLIDSGVSIDFANAKGYTPLMKAIAAAAATPPPQSTLPQLQRTRTTSSTHRQHRPSPSIHTADDATDATFDNAIVRAVLAFEPDVLRCDANGKTAADWAKCTHNTEALALLQTYERTHALQSTAASTRDARIAACRLLLQRHDAAIATLEQLFLQPHSVDERAFICFIQATATAIPFAAFAASVADLVAFERSANALRTIADPRAAYFVSYESRQGWTPLTKAAANNLVAVVQALVEHGALMDHETRLRHTALTWASYCGHDGVVLLLLRLGARVDQQTHERKTALIHAAANAQPTIVHHLLLALRAQSYPVLAKDAFDAVATTRNRRKSVQSATTAATKRNNASINRNEWHETFLQLVSVRDASGKNALQYAEERCGGRTINDDDDSDSDDARTAPDAAASAVLQQLETALQAAHSHAAYVATNEERTRIVACRSIGCDVVGPRDAIATHELHECRQRIVHCDACSAAVVYAAQAQHDSVDCQMRFVACHNLQFGCHDRIRAHEVENHSKSHCRKRQLQCRQLCGLAIAFDALVIHETAQCRLRTIACDLGCPATIVANESAVHRRKHCPKRLVACSSSSGGGGCGQSVAADELAFHRAHLCAMRLFACQWATNGCSETFRGSPESRFHHEQRACRFRVVACRNDCALSGSILACFLEQHYAWQCEQEAKQCPLGCFESNGDSDGEVSTLPAHLMDVHVLEDAGNCSKRRVRCPLDLCGKKLTLFDMVQETPLLLGQPSDVDRRQSDALMMSADVTMSGLEHRTTSLRALEQRVVTSERFIDRLRHAHSSSDHTDASMESDSPHAGARSVDPETWMLLTQSVITRTVLLAWLELHHQRLQTELEQVATDKRRRAVECRALTFAPSDDVDVDDNDSKRNKHLLEFADGHSEWLSLERREYDVHVTVAEASAGPQDAQDAAARHIDPRTTTFQCPRIEAHAVAHHVRHACVLRLVPCPLGCQQKLPSAGVATHVAKRCSMRNASCRLGCNAVMPFAALSEHEDQMCALRSVFCAHCHASVQALALDQHVERVCLQRPRRCRLGCAVRVAWRDVADHEATQCAKRLVPCALCNKSVWFCEQRTHELHECPLRLYGLCDAGCGAMLLSNEVGHHLLFSCVQRFVNCASCSERVVFSKLKEHKALLCPQRRVRCRRGCGAALTEQTVERHEDASCAKRLVFCSNKCGTHVMSCDVDAHLELACPMRVIACPRQCDERLVAYQFDRHWRRCRQRISPCGTGASTCARPIRLWFANRQLVRCAAHNETALLHAIKTNDDDLVTYLLQSVDAAAALRNECTNGFAPLSMAVSLGYVDVVNVLLRFNADVNAETSRGRTALAEACFAQHRALVELLIEHRANVSHTNRHGRNLMATVRSLAAIEKEQDAVHVAAPTNSNRSPWCEIIRLLEERELLERQQRQLFVSIATSDYDFVAQFLKFSSHRRGAISTNSNTKGANRPCDELERLHFELRAQHERVEAARSEHADAIRVLNESVANAEAKAVRVANLSAQVLDCSSQIARVAVHHDAALADSSALEVDMQRLIREITAQDIATLVNVHVPSDEYLVVMKAICMLSNVLPRGRRHATEYTDMEWWKAAQALLMDRTLLQRLRSYRKSVVPPDVMAKVRRECVKTAAFEASTASFDALVGANANADSGDREAENTPDSIVERKRAAQLPAIDDLRGNIVLLLAAWVKGVEIEYKSHAEQQTLSDRKRRLAISLSSTRETRQQAQFDLDVATRSLPARQSEVDAARTAFEREERALLAAQQRLRAFQVLTLSALNGHTPLSFAAAVGNDAMVHMLLTHGAKAGFVEEEQHLCASFLQLLARDFVDRRRRQRQQRAAAAAAADAVLASRSDAAIETLVHSVALAFLLSHYRRKLAFFRQTHRVALHEAVFNGFPDIVTILLAHDAKLWHKTRVLPIRVFPGAIAFADDGDDDSSSSNALPGGWKLTPLIDDFVKPQIGSNSSSNATARKPMLLRETLELAEQRFDCKTYIAGKGWATDVTRYSETHALVTAALAKRDDALAQQQRAIAGRKRVAKKTAELRALHSDLEAAIVARDFVAVSTLLDAGAYADYETSRDGVSALMAACIEERFVENRDGRDVLAVAFLLDRPLNRASVNFESSTGRTALLTAATHGTLLCMQMLLDRGANVNYATRDAGLTALMAAAATNQLDVVRFLIEQPTIDVFAIDRVGRHAFAHAQTSGRSDAMHLLGAAMGGNRGQWYASSSALHGVCKWGCGFMAPTEDRAVRQSVVTDVTHPLAHHEAHTCRKRFVACPLACDTMLLWAEDVPQHLANECRLRKVPCPQSKCSATMPFERLATHVRDDCAFRIVVCACGEHMTHEKHVVHAATRCPMRLVACPLGCRDALVVASDLKSHQSAVCVNRRVRCRNGCSASDVRFCDRDEHERKHCAMRRVACKWRCDEVVVATTQLVHERDECLLRQVACPNKCGQQNVPVGDMQQHVAEQCARRLVPCALGCGRRVPLHVADQHMERECRKRMVQCDRCREQFVEDDRSAHDSTTCPQRIAVCGLCGQTSIPLALLPTHRATQCKMRPVQCQYKCFVKVLLAHEKERHEATECAFRTIWCPLGCQQVLVAQTLKKHERVCDMRFVVCTLGCGVELRERDRVQHEATECSQKRRRNGASR